MYIFVVRMILRTKTSEVTSQIMWKIQYILRDIENPIFGIPSLNYMFIELMMSDERQ